MSYYSKIKQCDYCKDLDCEIVMVKSRGLGTICPQCDKNLQGQLKHAGVEKEQMAIEIETY
jgi:hypothetical protein